MANIRSSEKDARRSAAQATRNRSIRSSVKTAVTRARKALAGGDGGAEQVLAAVSGLDRAVTKGVLHRNNAARRKARLMKRLSLTAQAAAKPEASRPQAAAPKRRSPSAKKPAAGAGRGTRSRQSGK